MRVPSAHHRRHFTCDNGAVNPWLISAPAVLAAAGAATAYGAAYPRAQLFGATVWHTNSPRKLAITFDDGPNPNITPQLLDLLDQYQARATFFVVGRFARECRDLLSETSRRGHLIGNHTENHANLFWRGPSEIREEMRRCNDAISGIVGARAKWFRPPWGARNPWVVSSAAREGMRAVLWTELPGDWREKPAEWLVERLQPIARRIQNASKTADAAASHFGDILCLHDGDHRFLNGDRSRTLEALRHWLPRWRDLGLEFVTIDEAVSSPAA
jgi:peptidoglycan/xylan/chitin deacetylase (PgdA/CDA1 family)